MTVSGNDLLGILGAVVLAGFGGELFLKGVLGAAISLRVPRMLVATGLAALATSSPELTVSTIAALAGQPEIGLGDALGSNVVNISLLFGLALLCGPLRIEHGELGRDYALALAIPIVTFWLAADGLISRKEGSVLLLAFAIWIALLIRAGMAWRKLESVADPTEQGHRPWRSIVFGLIGLAALILAGRLFVASATGIATAFGVDGFIVGATVVAIGTSLPELMTVLLARFRGHDDVGVGTLLGSNLFNGMAIVGVAASIDPIDTVLTEAASTLAAGILGLLILIPGRDGVIGRGRGLLLLTSYAVFVLVTGAAGRAEYGTG